MRLFRWTPYADATWIARCPVRNLTDAPRVRRAQEGSSSAPLVRDSGPDSPHTVRFDGQDQRGQLALERHMRTDQARAGRAGAGTT